MRNQRKSGKVSGRAKWFKIITAGVVIADGLGIYAAHHMLSQPVVVEDAAMEEALIAAAKPDYQFRPQLAQKVIVQPAAQPVQAAAQPQTAAAPAQLALAKPLAKPVAAPPVPPQAKPAIAAPRTVLARSGPARTQVAQIELPRPAFGPSAIKPAAAAQPAKSAETRLVKQGSAALAVAKSPAPAPVMVKKTVKPVGVTLAAKKTKPHSAFASVFAHGIGGVTNSRITEPTGSYGGLATRADAGGQVSSMHIHAITETPVSAPEIAVTSAPAPDDAQTTAKANTADTATKALGTEPSADQPVPEAELPAI